MLEIQTKQLPLDVVVLELAGRITIGRNSQQLEWTTTKMMQENRKKVIFDLTGVNHIDSTGIGIIVMSAGQLKNAGGQLRLVCSDGHVAEVLKMTNVDKVVEIHKTTTAAAAGF